MGSERQTRRPADLTPSLVLRLRAGQEDAGELLNELYGKPMLQFCRNHLSHATDAEDAVQAIFCKVLAAKDVPDNFRAWLYRVARCHCLDVLRRRARRRDAQVVPADSGLAESGTGALTRLVRQEQRARLAHLLRALPADQREVLCLRYADELSRAEIAFVLDLPESVVKSRLFEGLERLREHTSLLDRP
jgi:RNA polymerase sigma-70 factor (ECF subfamily)